MNGKKDNLIVTKSYAFALEIIKLYKELSEKKEFVLSQTGASKRHLRWRQHT